VKVQIKKSEAKRYINTYPQPFLASTGAKSAEKTQFNIFKRVGKARLPIKILRTLSVPQMITNENVTDQIQQAAQGKLNERLEHEIARVMTLAQKNISR
jgi:hypothetical protein